RISSVAQTISGQIKDHAVAPNRRGVRAAGRHFETQMFQAPQTDARLKSSPNPNTGRARQAKEWRGDRNNAVGAVVDVVLAEIPARDSVLCVFAVSMRADRVRLAKVIPVMIATSATSISLPFSDSADTVTPQRFAPTTSGHMSVADTSKPR